MTGVALSMSSTTKSTMFCPIRSNSDLTEYVKRVINPSLFASFSRGSVGGSIITALLLKELFIPNAQKLKEV